MNVREWALPVYTILMQLAVGALFVLWIIRWLARSKFRPGEIDRIVRNPILVIVLTAVVAMVAAHFHLSKPYHSFLAILNFKSSWLSREIAFSILFLFIVMVLVYLVFYLEHRRKLITIVGWFAILTGSILVYCMASIYLIPTQEAWDSVLVVISFFTTALMVGAAAMVCLMVLDLKFAEIKKTEDVRLREKAVMYVLSRGSFLIFFLVLLSLLIIYVQTHSLNRGDFIARASLSLLFGLYLPLFMFRQILLLCSIFILGIAVHRMFKLRWNPQNILVPVYLSCLLILVGEIVGRFLFYAAHIRVGL